MYVRQPSSQPTPIWLTELGWAERYVLAEVIGSGGMGQVWRAHDTTNDRDVAMKIIDPARSGDEHLLARLETEAASLLRLRDAGQHPNIVPILDFQQSDAHACFVMDFIPGQDLRSWCHAHRLDFQKCAALIAKAARAAGWCHQHGIVHRDLKPANILINSATGEPIVVDFSIAKTDEPLALTLTHEALGTTPYMAPEQIDRSRAAITPATDVYALGATLYELLTHILPHPGDLAQILKRHQNEERPARPSLLNKDVPHDLESICLKALSPRPTDRYPSGDALADDLECFLAGQPVQARPMSTFTYFVRQASRRPGLSTAIAACLLISGIATWAVQRAAQERHRHELETVVTKALQARTWSRTVMQQAESALAELAIRDPSRSAQLTLALVDDVYKDIALALQQSVLTPADFAWMREVIPMLGRHAPEEMKRLETLLSERQLRWETIVNLSAPFRNRDGLFPGGRQVIQDDLLFPVYNDSIGKSPAIRVKEHLTMPLEISTTMVSKAPFHHVAFGLIFDNIIYEIALYAVKTASVPAIVHAGHIPRDAPGGIFYIIRQGVVQSALHIPDTQLFDRPFSVTMRVERNRVQASLNQQWQLTTNEAFALTASTPNNYFRISWAKTLGMKDLIIRTQTAGEGSPLDRGDMHASAGEWAQAQTEYEALIGHPFAGLEASYKIGLAQTAQADHTAASQTWERIGLGPPSLWRDLSNYQLWHASVMRQGIIAAKQWLDRLPSPAQVQPGFTRFIPTWEKRDIATAYAQVSWGMNFLRVRLEDVEDAVKAFSLLEVSPVQTAAQLAGAYHIAGLDEGAHALFRSGLRYPPKTVLTAEGRRMGLSGLDQWCRISTSESEALLSDALRQWISDFPKDTSFTSLERIDKARVHTRAGRFVEAEKLLQSIYPLADVEPRIITDARMVEGAVLHLQGRSEEAQKAWLAGIEAAKTSEFKSPLHLCDRIILHSATRTWNTEVCNDVITRLIGRSTTGLASVSMQAAFLRAFLNDPAYVPSLNAFTDDAEGQQIVLDYALSRVPLRDINRQWFAKMLERHFLATAFPVNTSHEDRARVREIIDEALHFIATTSSDTQPLSGFLIAWTSPQMRGQFAEDKLKAPATLIAKARWLLAQRYLHSFSTEAAKPLLEAVQSDQTLNEAWRQSIAAQLR